METGSLLVKGAQMLKQRLELQWRKSERDWVDTCLLRMAQVGQTAVIALLAAEMGRQPHEEEVAATLEKAIDDLSLLPRLHRLFSELLRSPSARRQRRIAAVLFAGPFITKSEADRDRLDLLVEQLLEEDIASLKAIVEGVSRALNGGWPLGFDVQRPDKASHYRLIINTQLIGVEVNRLSFDRLAAAHCLARLSVSWTQVTALGEFLVQHMDHDAIRAGVGSGDPGNDGA